MFQKIVFCPTLLRSHVFIVFFESHIIDYGYHTHWSATASAKPYLTSRSSFSFCYSYHSFFPISNPFAIIWHTKQYIFSPHLLFDLRLFHNNLFIPYLQELSSIQNFTLVVTYLTNCSIFFAYLWSIFGRCSGDISVLACLSAVCGMSACVVMFCFCFDIIVIDTFTQITTADVRMVVASGIGGYWRNEIKKSIFAGKGQRESRTVRFGKSEILAAVRSSIRAADFSSFLWIRRWKWEFFFIW